MVPNLASPQKFRPSFCISFLEPLGPGNLCFKAPQMAPVISQLWESLVWGGRSEVTTAAVMVIRSEKAWEVHEGWLREVSFRRTPMSPGQWKALCEEEDCGQVPRPWMNMEV